MKILALFTNYSIIIIGLFALLSLCIEYDKNALLGALIFFVIAIPNIIYIHNSRSINRKKEEKECLDNIFR